MAASENTIQTGSHQHNGSQLTNYALFLSGLNVTHDVLQNYDPLRTGYGRLFMVRQPVFLTKCIPTKMAKFKHILEYGNTSIQGIGDISQETNNITGGYAGKSFEIPSFAQDGTTGFNVQVYEFSGSPVREVIHTWINGMNDVLTGLTHYNGLAVGNTDAVKGDKLYASQHNQTAEFIYVATDNTGTEVEYACMFANCFPKAIKTDHFNYQSGTHELVDYNIDFAATKYESIQINTVAKSLLDRYKILANSLNFYSGIKANDADTLGNGHYYDVTDGQLKDRGRGSDGSLIKTNDEYFNTPLDQSTISKINAWTAETAKKQS